MRITDRDNASHTDAARIIGTALWAAVRGGNLTTRQKAQVDRILDRADVREGEKDQIRRAASTAARQTEFEARKKKAVDKAVEKAERRAARRWF